MYSLKQSRNQISLTEARYVFITGCDTGFGYLAAKRLDAIGCHVIAGCLTETGEKELTLTCSSRLRTVHLDVTKHESVVEAFSVVSKILPPNKGLWGLINNAGVLGPMAPIEWLTLKDYVDVFNVNCLGCIDVTQVFLPLVTKEKGRIINMSSSSGRNSLVRISAYAVSKYGIEAFSDSLRRELREFGVSVHIITPGGHNTNIFQRHGEKTLNAWKQTKPEIQEKYGENCLKILLRPNISDVLSNRLDDVVQAYEHALLSRFPRARYVVGWDAKLIIIPLQWLPEWLGDRLLEPIVMKN